MTTPPLIIGHRGAPGYRPEHTAAGYELAFELGADAVEPDLVATKDGVLVVRHENEISGTTDIASRPEFAARRTTQLVAGEAHSGWFTEDFTWAELATLRARERIPALRGHSASFDGRYPLLRLSDLVRIIDEQSELQGRELRMVAELKNATHFGRIGLPLDELFADQIAGFASAERLVIESFEHTVLSQLRERGIPGRYVFLAETTGSPADLEELLGDESPTYDEHLTTEGLAVLARTVDGVSVDKNALLTTDATGRTIADPALVERAHAAGLAVFTWTLRPENEFLAADLHEPGGPQQWGRWLDEFRLVIGTGVDGVFADHPDLVVAALEPI